MLTYADRLAAMRETKIRHTIEKMKQDGYRDLDDFGWCRFPKGTLSSPITTAKTEAFTVLTE